MGEREERINNGAAARHGWFAYPRGPEGIAVTPACGACWFVCPHVSERGCLRLRGLPYERGGEERGAWGVGQPTHPAAPFESRGAGREKRGKRSWPLARAEGVASAAEFGNSNWKYKWRFIFLMILLLVLGAGWAVA